MIKLRKQMQSSHVLHNCLNIFHTKLYNLFQNFSNKRQDENDVLMNCDWHILQIKKTRLPFTDKPFRINKILDIAISIVLNKLLVAHLCAHDETMIIIILFERFV